MSKKRYNKIPMKTDNTSPANADKSIYIAGMGDNKLDYGQKYSKITPNSGITLSALSGILKNPQDWSQHKKLLQYCAYYSHYDNMLSGALFNILIPFSQIDYKLIGGDEDTKIVLKQWLDNISFEDLLEGMAFDYYLYGRFIAYLYDNGALQLLPVFRCQVESLDINGNPLISFEIDKMKEMSQVDISKFERKYAGYPKEIAKSAIEGKTYALLDSTKTFSCCLAKSAWEKYPIPMLTSTFPYVIKKEMLSQTESIELDNMSKSLLEVQVGDKDKTPKPSMSELKAAGSSYTTALKSGGASVAVVAWNVKANWLAYSNKEVLDNITNSTSFQNWNILAALSISPILSAGSEHFNKGTSGSYSQTTAAISTINKRINGFLKKVSLLMNDVIIQYAEDNGLDMEKLPKLAFDKVDLTDDGTLIEELLKLYDRGLVSNKTLFENTELDYTTEKENRINENADNDEETFKPHPTANQMSSDDGAGRPVVPDNKRKSDKDNSSRSNSAPKSE